LIFAERNNIQTPERRRRPEPFVGSGKLVGMEAGEGLFGPESVAWRLHAAPAMLTGGLRALLLQVWHPLVADAVASHSEVARNPWRRYQATVEFVTDVTYGDAEVARAAINRVRSVHNTVAGVAASGELYSANDPGLLGYVHATLVDSALRAAAIYGPRISQPERDAYVAEMAKVASLLGVDDPPRDAASVSEVLLADPAPSSTRAGRDLAWLLMLPPLPAWMRPAYGVLFASAVDLLPRRAAVDLALLPVWRPARPAVRAANTALLAGTQLIANRRLG
jgi:uncharacterized protein (DUF2236 family)